MTTAYTSTVVARGHVVVGVALGVVAALLIRPWPVAVPVALVLVATGVYLGTVRLALGADGLRVAQGPWGRSRTIPRWAVASVSCTTLTTAQAFGLGLPWNRRASRLTPRRGPALVVELTDGEVLRITTPDPGAAASLAAANRKDDR
ncbi:hypothetical protein [Streptantibioticus silvisoli]|uniref:PH domain-containing protein n=1 Tax=Streptantibioticus silvisoli TaxID=2705255 RepID=A0ABT6W5K9_9ACTN|nr:hypothetical protein [Streptantibioticus silvisoli]MDI5964953.1 hypothetical protein [Streptantibioticus silvisoli]